VYYESKETKTLASLSSVSKLPSVQEPLRPKWPLKQFRKERLPADTWITISIFVNLWSQRREELRIAKSYP